jgi:hypothetical protein
MISWLYSTKEQMKIAKGLNTMQLSGKEDNMNQMRRGFLPSGKLSEMDT